MSNRPVFFLCFRLRVREKAKFGFACALPFFVLFSLVDMLDDFTQLAKLFAPRAAIAPSKDGKRSIARCKSLAGIIMDLLWELAMETGPLDLVDVDVTDKSGSVLVKLLTR